MIYMLFAPFDNHEVEKITKYIREDFFIRYPDEAKRVWLGLIKYSIYIKANPYFYNDNDSDRVNETKEKEEKFVQEISTDRNIELDFSEISLEKCECYLLARVFLITPYNNTTDEDFESFIKHFIPLLTADLQQEEDYSHNRNRRGRKIHFDTVLDAKHYLVELLLKAKSELAKSVLDLIIDPIYQHELHENRGRNDFFEFSSQIPERVICKLDEIIANSNDKDLNKELIANFWKLWQHFFDKIKASGKTYFLKTLFLDIMWKETAFHWQPLENKKDFYQTMVKDLGKYRAISILNVFSTIGEKTFLPESISWLVEIFKSDTTTNIALLFPFAFNCICVILKELRLQF